MLSVSDVSTGNAVNSSSPMVAYSGKTVPHDITSEELWEDTSSDGLLLSQYPWTKTAQLLLNRLSPKDIDIWSNQTKNYWDVPVETRSEVQPVITHTKGYGLRNQGMTLQVKRELKSPTPIDDSTEQLLQHFTDVLDQAKQFVTKPNKKRKRHPGSDSTNVQVGTVADQSATIPQNAELNSEQPVQNVTPTPDPCVGTQTSTRKIKCKLCKGKFLSVKELNEHHVRDHGIEKCDNCDKCFTTRSALDKHMYQHREQNWVCDSCGKSFSFETRMLQHKLVHDTEPKHRCTYDSCEKKFKNVGDMNHHIKTHDKLWYKCPTCPYKNKDKRNCDSHMRVHNKEGDKECYECAKCFK